jgi:uncharacterized protein (DUF2236 family)
MKPLQRAIQAEVHKLVGFGSGAVDFDHPRGDPGLFGPGTACWRVHSDFTTMMAGGVAALLLQMLHPAALAGVWDHSRFRDDMAGRLRRTARFVSGTTYAGRDEALRLIGTVRAVHDRVRGHLPDGSAYSANDPALLTWVHVAEMSSFLAAHRRYAAAPIPPAEQDRYFAETAIVARRLGAREIPETRAEVEAYLQAMRPFLRHDERTREVCAALLSEPSPNLLLAPLRQVVMQAGRDLLPAWAAGMHGFERGPFGGAAATLGINGMAKVMRWALRDGSSVRARKRLESEMG